MQLRQNGMEARTLPVQILRLRPTAILAAKAERGAAAAV